MQNTEESTDKLKLDSSKTKPQDNQVATPVVKPSAEKQISNSPSVENVKVSEDKSQTTNTKNQQSVSNAQPTVQPVENNLSTTKKTEAELENKKVEKSTNQQIINLRTDYIPQNETPPKKKNPLLWSPN